MKILSKNTNFDKNAHLVLKKNNFIINKRFFQISGMLIIQELGMLKNVYMHYLNN